MKFITVNGGIKNINVGNHLIDWEDDSLSIFQKDVKSFLKRYWKHHVVVEEFPVAGSRMRVDFIDFTSGIAIEVNGDQHIRYNKHMHSGDPMKFKSQVLRDLTKLRWCEKNNLKFVDIYPDDMPLTAQWFKEKHGIIL